MNKEVLDIICNLMNVNEDEISDITKLTVGMTNRSYIFTYKNERYIVRIPGVGTDTIINRKEEAAVYNAVNGKGICEDIVYINPENGYKISKFIENTHICDAQNEEDVVLALKTIVGLHDLKLKVDHEWDTYERFDAYDSMWKGHPSIFSDYEEVKEQILDLRGYIETHSEEKVLTHVDAVDINILITNDKDNPRAYLIDWEYAAMHDPHLDIVCFGIFANYDKKQMDWLIDKYFEIRHQKCSYETRTKLYALIATFGLLWTSWSEGKRVGGQDFEAYEKTQYRYAKEYLKYVQERLRRKSA